MSRYDNRNINPGKFLLFLIVFGVISVLFFRSFSVNKVEKEVDKGTQKDTIQVEEEYLDSSSLNELAQEVVQVHTLPTASYSEMKIVQNTEEGVVLGSEAESCGKAGGSKTGCITNNGIKNPPLCGRGDVSEVVGDGKEVGRTGGGVLVNKNSYVEVWGVTVPMGLISGAMFVEDDRLAIGNKESGFNYTYPDSEDIILDGQSRRFCVPGEYDCLSWDDDIGTGPEDAFYLEAWAEEEEEPTNNPPPDKVRIKKELASACNEVHDRKPNPIKANRKGQYNEIHFMLPQEGANSRSNGAIPCMRSSADEYYDSNFFGCLEKRTSYNFLIFATVQIKDWLICTVGWEDKKTEEWHDPDPTHCKKTVLTAIKLSPMFGSIYKCLNKQCASRWMDMTNLGYMTPKQAQGQIPQELLDRGYEPRFNQPISKPFYVATPCKVRVDGIQFSELPCLWDMSVFQRNYEKQKASAIPKDDDIPATFEEYWKGVEAQLEITNKKCAAGSGDDV